VRPKYITKLKGSRKIIPHSNAVDDATDTVMPTAEKEWNYH
jgi:hypothetical protein